jgi:ankyrin repeat protein
MDDETALNQKLVNAAKRGDVHSVEDCLTNGADVDAFDPLALKAAIIENCKDAVEHLLEHYHDIKIRNRRATDALYIPSKRGYRPMVKLLLENGADVKKGQSALRVACKEGHMEILEMFLQRDGGVDVKSTGPIALRIAAPIGREGRRVHVEYGYALQEQNAEPSGLRALYSVSMAATMAGEIPPDRAREEQMVREKLLGREEEAINRMKQSR